MAASTWSSAATADATAAPSAGETTESRPLIAISASAAEAAPLASSLSLSTLDVLHLEREEERDARPAADAPRARLLVLGAAAGVAVPSRASMPVRDAERDERREGRATALFFGGDFFLGALVRVFWVMLW